MTSVKASQEKCLLFVDTSHNLCIALYHARNKECCFSKIYTERRSHEHIQEALETALQSTGYSIHSISSIVVATGPGSFTGLRIGIAFCQGLGFAQQIPIYPISTLDIIKTAIPTEEKGLAIIPANKGQFYLTFSEQLGYKEEYLYMPSSQEATLFPDTLWPSISYVLSTNLSAMDTEFFLTLLNRTKIDCIYDRYPFQSIVNTILQREPITSGILRPNYIQPPAAKPQERLQRIS
jgi:tRNA threonylcarbamoyladenosine biosynthesis protein TsaB